MAVEDILKKIRADAEDAAGRIVAEGKAAADEVTAEARGRIDAQAERLRAKARQRADEEKNRIVTLARLSGRRELLSEKQRLIDWDRRYVWHPFTQHTLWNAADPLIIVAAEDEYLIDQDVRGKKLLAFLRQEVKVSGLVTENEKGKKSIAVKRFESVQE